MQLTQSQEDYLETILILKTQLDVVRAIDVAAALGFSKPSVSHALKELKAKDLIYTNDHGHLFFTKEGQGLAEQVYERHVYFKKQLIYWIVFLAISIITYNICILFTEISILIFIVKILICILIPNIIFYFIFKKSDELNYFKNLILNLLHKNNIGLLR